VEDLFNFMSSLPHSLSPDRSQWQLLSDYISKHKGEGEESLSPKDVALYLRTKGLSEKKIADAIQKAPSTVHEWVKVEK
jgi:DNA-binding NarL/FixJ family response regulator